MASVKLVDTTSLHKSPLATEHSNVRVVKNRVVVNAPYDAVFDFVATWSNLSKWLPMCESTKVMKGEGNAPMEVGDVLFEKVKSEFAAEGKIYTCVAKVPGVLVVLAGADEGESWVRWVAHLSATPLEGNKSLFCRVFQQNVQDTAESTRAVVDPAVCQKAMDLFKEAVEKQ